MFTNHLPRRHAVPPEPPKKVKKNHPYIEAIFSKLYKVKMRSIDTLSIEEQREYGTYVTGNAGLDKASLEAYTWPHITIEKMVDYFKEGIHVYLVNPDDSKAIYEAVCNHTSMWRNQLHMAYNMGEAPLEDLIAMEQFASAIYSRAKFEYIKRPDTTNVVPGTLAHFLYNGSGLQSTTFNSDRKVLTSGIVQDRTSVKESEHNPDIAVFRNAFVSIAKQGHDTRNL